MPFTTDIVPMPRWSTPVGCTKLALTIIVLALVAACTAIWGGYPAFGLTLFTASLSLAAFGYYLIALSFRPKIYNKFVVLVLESSLTLFWFISLILLAGWLGASTAFPRWNWDTPTYITTPYGVTVDLTQRDLAVRTFDLWSSPLEIIKREASSPPNTSVKVHGQDVHDAGRILAGLSAGIAGIIFVLYAITLTTFSINFTKQENESQSASTIDEEAQTAASARSNTDGSMFQAQSGPPTPPAISEPLRVDTLPKDFEPKPQTQKHYLTPEQASKAGIEPPTPVLKAQNAEKEKDKTTEATEKVDPATAIEPPVSPIQQEMEK